MTANMLAAYYGRNEDSRELFSGLQIRQDAGFSRHLNQYDVIFLNMQEFLSRSHSIQEMLGRLQEAVLWDLLKEYGTFHYYDSGNLNRTMQDIFQNTRIPFVVIIDEWIVFSGNTRRTMRHRGIILIFCGICLRIRNILHWHI